MVPGVQRAPRHLCPRRVPRLGRGRLDWVQSPRTRTHGTTRKGKLLVSVPCDVITWTLPVRTVVPINELENTLNVAAVPLNVTVVAPVG